MKTLIVSILASLAALSAIPDEPVVVTTLRADGTTNTWTQADLVAALQLLNRKYHRDIGTNAGREAWHGKRVGMPTTDPQRGCIVYRYEDGTVFEDRIEAKKPVVTLSATGVPAALAAARQRRAANAATTNVVTVTVGK